MYISANKSTMHRTSCTVSLMLVAAFVSGCISLRPLPSRDEEICSIMEPYRNCKTYSKMAEYIEESSEMVSLAARLNAVCQKRKVSRDAVMSAAQIEPFAYNDRSLDFAYMRHGFYVTGIEFVFSDRGWVLSVRTFNLTL